ncbi:MAG: methyl-accepting chemotaxis protein [Butyrivibrio sp.]|nr:methyl-accepting chemotaxis protein [Butyrivibrio sp.]
MKKTITKYLFIYMLAAFLCTITAIFVLQTFVNQNSNTVSSQERLETVKEKLESNEENIQRLTENLSEDNLAKARAFADMLAMDSSINGNMDKLNEIKDRLKVNELHIIDEDGIITSSTIDSYIGFDMKSGEQSNAFMVIVDDPSIEIAQEPQQNVAEGIVMQYIGVARKDDKGLVQVGVRPEVLESTLAGTDINVVLNSIDYGENGYVYAIDQSSGLILAHPDNNLIGTAAKDAGFPDELTGRGKAKINNKSGYYQAEAYDGKIIGTFMPSNEYYSARRSQLIVVAISMLIIFGVLLVTINRLVDSKIIRGINNIITSTSGIAAGNFNITVNEKGNEEYTQLSESINKMLSSIHSSIKENETLLEQQKADVENNKTLIRDVKSVCTDLDAVSSETLENADSIYNGTGEQKDALEGLQQIMNRLVDELNGSVDVSVNVTSDTSETVKKIMQTQSQVDQLKESMYKIAEMSAAIEKIIDEINSIAQQTNMLSLNASIEAARAGEMGKGFAVVATQVGELAARSSQAAKETNELITNSILAVESGKEITDKTAETFSSVVEDIEKTNADVGKITGMVRDNVSTVADAVKQIESISAVVERNVEISQNTKRVSANMAEITGKLLDIVES